MIAAVELLGDEREAVRTALEERILARRLAAGVHPALAARAAGRIFANTTDDEGARAQAWVLRDLETDLGTAWTQVRDRRAYLADVSVAVEQAAPALAAVVAQLAAQGPEQLTLDVPVHDRVAGAMLAAVGTRATLQSTQMQLDLAAPVGAPPRVTLRPMTDAEFATYAQRLVSTYAQDLLDSGAFLDLETATASSAAQTDELLPDGLHSPGQHLWTAYADAAPVGVLWIHADGPAGFIYDIEVLPEQRRRGYGREVLDAGAHAAADLGAEVLGLNVFGQNDGARALYEKAGYATTEQSYRVML